ncbi:hypothetical protein GMST_08410 [Geomonas silvestris]|uniref:Lipoprotein n=1 Tax=Geomonas silvestris TaxID=2740184 RepID=A0A6V8MEU2_9BACT|nr:DUF6448 family protein [Geomonas silvestris]GFO58516.1 hypothetical protein GMST_08410 [Geomonas silvestris]
MKTKNLTLALATAAVVALSSLSAPRLASAHCDTLDGPVVRDAHRALESKNVTPVLKWVKAKDEYAVKAAFDKALAAGGGKTEAAHEEFFATLVRIHRAGEGAPFTGLKPAGAVEPAVAEADKALASGSAETLEHLVTKAVQEGIRKRFERVAAAYRHKDESVVQGREFVEAYVDFTHFVENLHTAGSAPAHGGGDAHSGHGSFEGAGEKHPDREPTHSH